MKLKIQKEVILAPLAGYTHSAFRRLCKRLGAHRTYSELMNATGIIYKGEEKELAYFTDEERPIHLQVYGRNPEEIAEAARKIAEKYKPEAIDINFGCSVKKVLKAKAAGYLLQFPKEMGKIVAATAKALKPLNVPVTAKIRLGFYEDTLEEIAEELLKANVSAIALHPRTAKQGFSGNANWERVKDLKKIAGDTPIIGSGDIRSWKEIDQKFEETGCDGVMIGRAALANPWIFKEFKEKKDIEVRLKERIEFILRELQLMWEFFEKERACKVIKSQISQIFKGIRGKAKLNDMIMRSKTCEELLKNLKNI
ncbi:dihydrouridine synthase DuS [Desulfurobacterium thermolithotrophum DSM 11699]|uniref:tRNA-dihydrouridine synthase n=1 Tax=Desulfurobacterium thermolithotrophum (strain DSM 11699 / BSA) TaxID=868864 RepID=F0S1H4_DESTD|nr:tRNA-dihydrouridine synthase family protein [Desulfurobacterium thermolithotrophum]ADY73977.1 dihydrouridine synthase DuS [Desulfurobacterium thermolithotrophum DSM 11699]